MIRPLVLAVALVCISIFCCNLGKAYYEEEPETGGTGVVGYDPYTGSGIIGHVPETGEGVAGDDHDHDHDHHDPVQIVDKALLCFHDKHIYSSCEEAYRLSESGYLHVPPEYVDEYCNGPCLAETHLVLNCLENIMEHFVFFNKATIGAIRETIKAGCGHGPERGDFNVAEHLEAEEDSAYKKEIQIPFGIGLAMIVNALLL
ncbi:hypothetical protein JCGZ_18965 [Jatropha curcas]|uniref:DUF7731 domain-containing protein n=1 Tax=Jatropha curcas TaxID=180498 RepID=A0A067K6J1_JATCU|nr:uncharacterized protein LOC105643510 [Jatropha curcas]KDP27885.1 hypothetical protein JCGZ_18965 [Jatropha curcas]